MKRTLGALGSIVLALALGACSRNVATAPEMARQGMHTLASDHSMNGAAGQMPAYYDSTLFTVNMKQMPDAASASTIASNTSINEIYATNDLDEEQDFIPVLDAIQGDGFNPLWRQVLISFNAGFTPHQFFSDTEVEAAALAGEITLNVTDEVYRCSVVGAKTTSEE